MRQALGRAIYDAKLMHVAGQQMLAPIIENRLLSDDEIAEIRQEATEHNARLEKVSPACQPIGPAPAHYGGSPLQLDLIGPMPPLS